MNSAILSRIARELERVEDNINDLAFCYRTYRDLVVEGKEPTRFATGEVAMDADGATRQLCSAIERLLKSREGVR